jgi:hypothetical protein
MSIDYQRCDRLGDLMPCLDLAALAPVPGTEIDLRRVWSGAPSTALTGTRPSRAGTP